MSWSASTTGSRRHTIAQDIAQATRHITDERTRVHIDSAVSAAEIIATSMDIEKPLNIALSGHVGDHRRENDKSYMSINVTEA